MTRNALHIAALFGRSSIVRSLIAGGADPNAADERGARPLHWATTLRGERCRRMVGVLLRRAADPFAPDAVGRTPEDWARSRGNRTALRSFEQHFSIAAARRLAHAGFTLVELLGVLAAGAALTVGTWTLYTKSESTKNIEAAVQQLADVSQAVRSAYISRKDFAELSTTTATADGLGAVNPWGQALAFEGVDLNGQANAGAQISTQGVPAASCAELAMAATQIGSVTVNGLAVSTPESAAIACAAADTLTVSAVVGKR